MGSSCYGSISLRYQHSDWIDTRKCAKPFTEHGLGLGNIEKLCRAATIKRL